MEGQSGPGGPGGPGGANRAQLAGTLPNRDDCWGLASAGPVFALLRDTKSCTKSDTALADILTDPSFGFVRVKGFLKD